MAIISVKQINLFIVRVVLPHSLPDLNESTHNRYSLLFPSIKVFVCSPNVQLESLLQTFSTVYNKVSLNRLMIGISQTLTIKILVIAKIMLFGFT